MKKYLNIIVLLSYLLMVTINALANIIPINGVTTVQVSEAYPNLFTPAPYTFSIWGLIYFLLGLYVLYQLGFFRGESCSPTKKELLSNISLYFIISSVANAAWVLSWHYDLIALTMILMIVILVSLITINRYTSEIKLNSRDNFFIKLPFSIYFGWITVATIANATVLLVSLGWNGFGVSEPIWTSIALILGLIISVATIFKNKDVVYGLTVVWGYTGILVKHISESGFNGQYPLVIYTVIFCMVVLVLVDLFILKDQKI